MVDFLIHAMDRRTSGVMLEEAYCDATLSMILSWKNTAGGVYTSEPV